MRNLAPIKLLPDAIVIVRRGTTTHQGSFFSVPWGPDVEFCGVIPVDPKDRTCNATMTRAEWTAFERSAFTRENRRFVRSLLPSCFEEDWAFEGYHPDLGWYVDAYYSERRAARFRLVCTDNGLLMFEPM